MKLTASWRTIRDGAVVLALAATGVWLGVLHATWQYAPTDEMARAFSERALFARFRAALACVERQGPAGCENLAKWLERRENAARLGGREIFRAVLYRWGETDPHAALEFLGHTRMTDELALSQGAILHGWFAKDAKAALEWCRANALAELPCDAERLTVMERRLRTLAEFDPTLVVQAVDAGQVWTDFSGAAPFLKVHQPPGEVGWLPESLRQRLHRSELDPKDAQLWLGLIHAWAESQPMAVYRWLLKTENLPVGQAAAINGVIARWFREEPAKVADLLVYENHGDRWLESFNASFQLWARRDPEGYVQWIRQLPKHVATDRFLLLRAIIAAEANPDVGLGIALIIRDTNLRDEIVEDCASLCRKYFPTHYPEWLRKNRAKFPPGVLLRSPK